MSGIDLIEWLRAQMDEDEREWASGPGVIPDVHDRDCGAARYIEGEFLPDECDCGWPERIMAEVRAKRAILDLHLPKENRHYASEGRFYVDTCCETCGTEINRSTMEMDGDWPCETLLAIAQPYAGRPGWQPEWVTSDTIEASDETRALNCIVPVATEFLEEEVSQELLRDMAIECLTRTATDDGYTLLEDTVTESDRQPYTWVDTGETDDDDQPIQALVPLWMAPEGSKAESWSIWFNARARVDKQEVSTNE